MRKPHSQQSVPKILTIEADTPDDQSFTAALASTGLAVDVATSGREGIAKVMAGEYDAIALDRWLPDLDGVKVLTTLRGIGIETPVVIISATTAVEERIEGLRAGCDDYLARPFSNDEMIARLEVVMRRRSISVQPSHVLKVGPLSLDLLKQRLSCGKKAVRLRPTERRLLEFMMRNAGRVLTRTAILEGVWGNSFDPGTNLVDVHIGRLRNTIEIPGEQPQIRTVRGVGYILHE
ncbi:response regulator transcription factor [Paraburkholderia tropica]|uniref:response regulator transcription factor n=1 Tax=Paraburkholderia tropica TaxID=92647 RepID=UPI002AB0DC58|nr:response regulator transcription factor [Paraburkholderia tropica]